MAHNYHIGQCRYSTFLAQEVPLRSLAVKLHKYLNQAVLFIANSIKSCIQGIWDRMLDMFATLSNMIISWL